MIELEAQLINGVALSMMVMWMPRVYLTHATRLMVLIK